MPDQQDRSQAENDSLRKQRDQLQAELLRRHGGMARIVRQNSHNLTGAGGRGFSRTIQQNALFLALPIFRTLTQTQLLSRNSNSRVLDAHHAAAQAAEM